MASAVMGTDEPSLAAVDPQIAGLESQVLNSQKVIARLNGELDNAALRISTLENVCSQNQTDLHDKRQKIKALDEEINEREETNDRLFQESKEKEERIAALNELVVQLKDHIKQIKHDEEQRREEQQQDDHARALLDELQDPSSDNLSIAELRTQLLFDRQVRQLISADLPEGSAEELVDQFRHQERVRFHELLQKSLSSEDISSLIDSEDILFESLTHLNSLVRLKETLSRDSMQLQHLRWLLQLNDDNPDEAIPDLINKRECVDYLRSKIDNRENLTDLESIKLVLHDYFDFQQQQSELKEFLRTGDEVDVSYAQILIERQTQLMQENEELKTQIQSNQQTIKELNEQLTTEIEQRKDFDAMIEKYESSSSTELADDSSKTTHDRLRSILESLADVRQTVPSESALTSQEDSQSIVDALNKQIEDLKQEALDRKNRLNEISRTLHSDSEDENMQLDLIDSSLRSSAKFSENLAVELSVDNDHGTILQRIHDYQRIIAKLTADQDEWTEQTPEDLLVQLESMGKVDGLQEQLEDIRHSHQQLQSDIEDMASEYAPVGEESDLRRLRHVLQSLSEFQQSISDAVEMETTDDILQSIEQYKKDRNRLQDFLNQPVPEKQDVGSQASSDDDFYQQVQELLGVDEDDPEKILHLISELSSKDTDDRFLSTNEKLRTLLKVDDEHLVQSVMTLHENFDQLNEEHKILIQKEDHFHKSINQLLEKLDPSSDSSMRIRIDKIGDQIDTFVAEYSELTSNNGETLGLLDICREVPSILKKYNQLNELIDQIDFSESSEYPDAIQKLQTYLTRVDQCSRLITGERLNIDQAALIYQEKVEHDRLMQEKMASFHEELRTRLSVDNDEEIFDRLNEIDQLTSDLKKQVHSNHDSTDTLVSLQSTVAEQRQKITEHEGTVEKLRAQRERMLNKMKEMKINNETLANQLKSAQQSLDECHRKEIESTHQIEELEQQLRSAMNQKQVTLDECRSQQDLQETMKLENESLRKEMDTQKKLYEFRCRQIINEKNQLEKNKKEHVEQKQILEEENQQLQRILQSIKDAFDDVTDIRAVPEAMLKIRNDHTKMLNALQQQNEQMQIENEELILNIHQQENLVDEQRQMRSEWERRLLDNEQQINELKRDIKDRTEQYERLQAEHRSYKEEYQVHQSSPMALINIEQASSPPPPPLVVPLQQKAEPINWMTIDMKDEEIPLTTSSSNTTMNTSPKHSTLDNTEAFLNMLGEFKRQNQETAMPLVFREVRGDLFSVSPSTSLAHCVSTDLVMSKGIAVEFRDRFGRVDELKSQKVPIGGCAYLKVGDRYIFYLVTKQKYSHKPTMPSLEASLRAMRDLCVQHGVRQLAMPRIGCGLDRLNWTEVSQLIETLFQNDDIEITIYAL